MVLVFASMCKQIDSSSVFAVAFQMEGCSCALDSSHCPSEDRYRYSPTYISHHLGIWTHPFPAMRSTNLTRNFFASFPIIPSVVAMKGVKCLLSRHCLFHYRINLFIYTYLYMYLDNVLNVMFFLVRFLQYHLQIKIFKIEKQKQKQKQTLSPLYESFIFFCGALLYLFLFLIFS